MGQFYCTFLISVINIEAIMMKTGLHDMLHYMKLYIYGSTNGNLDSSLDECLLDEDIGGIDGLYLLDDIDGIKDKKHNMKLIFQK
jgi:hypothetical protein